MSIDKRKGLMWRADTGPDNNSEHTMTDDEVAASSSRGAETLEERTERHRTRVSCEFEAPQHVQSRVVDNTQRYSRSALEQSLHFVVRHCDSEELVVEVSGIDVAVANALRRILLAEVPAVAIEKVWIERNDSVIQDEVLAHRLGLIPLRVDARKLNFPSTDPLVGPSDRDALKYTLDVVCEGPDNLHITTKDLVFEWQGDQIDFMEAPAIPVHDDIEIALLAPGQGIKLTAIAVKGVGKDHAKFSPVGTAFYRLLPEVTILKPYQGAEAEALVQRCPMRVFDIEDSLAVVKRPRNCTLCRECIREPAHRDRIRLTRVRNTFIFTVESVGSLPPKELFQQAIEILKEKCINIRHILDEQQQHQQRQK